MSNRCRIMFWGSSYVKTPLQNGIGRYVQQLQRVTLKFCKSFGASLGMREFIEKDLIYFARENPGVVVYVKPRRHRAPCIKAEYLNGGKEYISTHRMPREDIVKWMDILRTKSGNNSTAYLLKEQFTNYPSIQGPWTPFTNKDPVVNVEEFPSPKLSETQNILPTGTQELLEMYQKQIKENAEKNVEINEKS